MEKLPFAAAFDALAFIVKRIRIDVADPKLAELVPALYFCFSSSSSDQATGVSFEIVPYPHFEVGWYEPEDVTDSVAIDVLGTNVFVHPDTLNRLAGKKLILKTIDSGGRRKADGTKQVLVAEDLAAHVAAPS
jgi:hypothetical protein